MKQKLLVAIVLLAICLGYLAVRHDALIPTARRLAEGLGLPSQNQPTKQGSSTLEQAAVEPDKAAEGDRSPAGLGQGEPGQSEPGQNDSGQSSLIEGNLIEGEQFAITDSPATTNEPSDSWGAGNALVASAASRFKSSPPLVANGQITINLFDVSVQGQVRFLLQGAGSPQCRTEYVFDSDSQRTNVIHVDNGEFTFLFRQRGDSEQLEFVERKRLVAGSEQSIGLQMGSLPALMQQLVADVQWQSPRQVELTSPRGTPATVAWQLDGRWNRQAVERWFPDQAANLPHAEQGMDPGRALEPLPQVPERFRLVLARAGSLELFPLRIDLLKRREQAGLLGGTSKSEYEPIASFAIREVVRVAALPDEDFQFTPGVYRTSDRTGFYRQQLERIGRDQLLDRTR